MTITGPFAWIAIAGMICFTIALAPRFGERITEIAHIDLDLNERVSRLVGFACATVFIILMLRGVRVVGNG
jgi:hypothetical protein